MKTLIFAIVFLAATISGISKTAPSPDEFSKKVISVGMVVSDLEKSLDFYTNIIGMIKTGGFDVPGDKSSELGLTDGREINVTVLKLEDSEQATEWKLMTFEEKSTHPTQKYIHNDVGIQYVTIFVKSITPFLKRIQKHKIPILSGAPSKLGNDQFFLLVQDPDGTFIELIGPE